jgi:hypothetical protein
MSDQCDFNEAWIGPCKNSNPCDKHDKLVCASCGEKATKSCDATSGLVCGAPLCDACEHTLGSRGTTIGLSFHEDKYNTPPVGLKTHCRKDQQVYKPWYVQEAERKEYREKFFSKVPESYSESGCCAICKHVVAVSHNRLFCSKVDNTPAPDPSSKYRLLQQKIAERVAKLAREKNIPDNEAKSILYKDPDYLTWFKQQRQKLHVEYEIQLSKWGEGRAVDPHGTCREFVLKPPE